MVSKTRQLTYSIGIRKAIEEGRRGKNGHTTMVAVLVMASPTLAPSLQRKTTGSSACPNRSEPITSLSYDNEKIGKGGKREDEGRMNKEVKSIP